MKVKIGNTYYYSAEELIMVVFENEKEKRDAGSMIGTPYTKMCKGPEGFVDEHFKEFMDMTPEEESRFTEVIR